MFRTAVASVCMRHSIPRNFSSQTPSSFQLTALPAGTFFFCTKETARLPVLHRCRVRPRSRHGTLGSGYITPCRPKLNPFFFPSDPVNLLYISLAYCCSISSGTTDTRDNVCSPSQLDFLFDFWREKRNGSRSVMGGCYPSTGTTLPYTLPFDFTATMSGGSASFNGHNHLRGRQHPEWLSTVCASSLLSLHRLINF